MNKYIYKYFFFNIRILFITNFIYKNYYIYKFFTNNIYYYIFLCIIVLFPPCFFSEYIVV